MLTKLLRSMNHLEVVAHQDVPDQVFLADGAHYDNTAVIPLLRRKCSSIIAVDSENSRQCGPCAHMMEMALADLGITFNPPYYEGDCLHYSVCVTRSSRPPYYEGDCLRYSVFVTRTSRACCWIRLASVYE